LIFAKIKALIQW